MASHICDCGPMMMWQYNYDMALTWKTIYVASRC
ncbi:uncharacterized protein G2W53_029135 [Senna tora]|uniref:Uncharacterized protein n=1 Tax=Senna tora TaxID=362788 RepID=A0A834WDF6_9FABA|nr:uncharacterized protein G2W53_029135 [Senna tora]